MAVAERVKDQAVRLPDLFALADALDLNLKLSGDKVTGRTTGTYQIDAVGVRLRLEPTILDSRVSRDVRGNVQDITLICSVRGDLHLVALLDLPGHKVFVAVVDGAKTGAKIGTLFSDAPTKNAGSLLASIKGGVRKVFSRDTKLKDGAWVEQDPTLFG